MTSSDYFLIFLQSMQCTAPYLRTGLAKRTSVSQFNISNLSWPTWLLAGKIHKAFTFTTCAVVSQVEASPAVQCVPAAGVGAICVAARLGRRARVDVGDTLIYI